MSTEANRDGSARGEGPQAHVRLCRGRRSRAAGNDVVSAKSGQVAAPIDSLPERLWTGFHGARGCCGSHAQDRPFLSCRNRGRFRRLAGIARPPTPTGASSSGAARWRTTAMDPWSPARIFTGPFSWMATGNPINKRNAWQARSVLYVRLIPPGAADVGALPGAAFRKMPKGRSHFTAKLNYRKFSLTTTRSSPTPGSPSRARIRRCSRPTTTAWNTASIQPIFRPMFRAKSRTNSRSADHRARVRRKPRRLPLGLARRMDAGGLQSRIASAGTIGASACCCKAI